MNKVAVVGLGNISIRHRKNLKILFPDAKLYAMSTTGRYPKEVIDSCDVVVASVHELISLQVDFAIIASPCSFHAQHAIPLIESGIPVLIEKPVTATAEDAILIERAQHTYNTPIAIGYCLRYLPTTQYMKKLLREEKVGEIYNVYIETGQYLPSWRPGEYKKTVSAQANLGGGALLELSHELDYIQWLLGPLKLRYAILRSSDELGLKVEDIVDIIAMTELKAVVSIHLDFLQRQPHRKCRIVGSEGVLEWDLIRNEIKLITEADSKVLYSEPKWDTNLMYLEMVKDFLRLMEGEENHCITLKEAMRTVSFISQVKKRYLN
ncbi:MAG: Gfo/Idh/MocA family protein [Halomonadaceae bacterium]|jgi:predicted dehydrogenase